MGRPRKTPDSEAAASVPRIIGGDLRGRKLAFAPAPRTRPMKDRVRETLFDLLGTRIRGATVLDLFAGTGALGFEAVSRGAERAVFVERHFPTADAIRRSAKDLGIEGRTDVRPGDALLWSKRMPNLPASAAWVAFISPPWSFFVDRTAELMDLVHAVMAAAPAGSTVVVESDHTFDPVALPSASEWQSRAIPPAVLHIWHRPPARHPSDG